MRPALHEHFPRLEFAGRSAPATFKKRKNQADPLCRVTGPRMNPSVDVGRPPRPFRHLRMAERCTPDPSSSRAPVHSALVQISVTRHHQPRRPAFISDARASLHRLASGRVQIVGCWFATKVMRSSEEKLVSGREGWNVLTRLAGLAGAVQVGLRDRPA